MIYLRSFSVMKGDALTQTKLIAVTAHWHAKFFVVPVLAKVDEKCGTLMYLPEAGAAGRFQARLKSSGRI